MNDIEWDVDGIPNVPSGAPWTCTDAQYHDACIEFGDAYFKGLGVPKDEKKGLGIMAQACREGSDFACVRLADKYVDGQAGKVDIPKAIELLDKACPRFSSACKQAEELRLRQQANP